MIQESESASERLPPPSDETQEGKPSSPTLGQYLRQVREQQGLDIDSVTQRLKISPKTIVHIENDQWAEFTHATYARGFVRDYAKFLEVDIAPQLEALFPPQTDQVLRSVHAVNQHFSGLRRAQNLWKKAAVAVVVVLMLGWLLWAFFLWEPAPLTQLQSPLNPSANPSAQQSIVINIQPLDNQTPTNTVVIASASSLQTPMSSPSMQSMVATKFVDSPPSVTEASDNTLLTIESNEQSWIEIASIQGETQHSQFVSKGNAFTRKIAPPFRLIVGNADSAQVRYRGQTINLSDYKTTNGNARIEWR